MKDKIFVGYNRRFYETIKLVKNRCENSPQGGTVIVNIPDSKAGKKQFLSNGCHMVDSLRYILGDFEVIDKMLGHKNCVINTIKMSNNKGSSIELINFIKPKIKKRNIQTNNNGITHIAMTVDNLSNFYNKHN